MKILVVDDDVLVRMMMQRALQDAGHEVAESSNGDEALARLRAEDFDLVVTDHVLPAGSIVPLAQYLGRERADLPVLVVSSAAPDERRDMATGTLPARGFLLKPFTRQELLDEVAGLCG